MKLVIVAALWLATAAICYADDPFEADFNLALKSDLSVQDLNGIFSRNQATFFAMMGDSAAYPLVGFRQSPLYSDNIAKLLDSGNANQRMFAYAVICAADDGSFEKKLIDRLQTEQDRNASFWAGLSLIVLKTTQTTPLFDWLVRNNYFSGTPVLKLYCRLDSTALQNTVYERIGSDNQAARILAVQILPFVPPTAKTEQVVKNAIANWDMDTKGYAIDAARQLKLGGLASLLSPLLNDKRTRQISLDALANSPSPMDQRLLKSQGGQESPATDYLDSLYRSSSLDNIRTWLQAISTKPVPEGYRFFVVDQPLLKSKDLLPDLLHALGRRPVPSVTAELCRALEGNTDSGSVTTLISLLSDADESVRYWAAFTVATANPAELKTVLPKLLRDKTLRVTSEADLATKNGIGGLHPVFDEILASRPDQDWKRSSIDYLASLPRPSDDGLFRSLVADPNEDFFVRQSAAAGLARLHDTDSVDLIVAACEQVDTSPRNAVPYLQALVVLKGPKARSEIEKFTKSDDVDVRNWAVQALAGWPK